MADTRYLDTFWAVCRARGFGRAARILGRTQPAVSYQIKMLEEQLGAPLFERRHGTPLLTAPGKRLRDFCNRFFGEWDALVTDLGAGAVTPSELLVDAVSGFGRYVLFPLMREGGYRHKPLVLRFLGADDIFERVSRGHSDLGFSYVDTVSSRLECTPVWTEELVLIAAGDSRGLRARSLRALCRETFVTYEECEYVFGRFFRSCFGTQPAHIASAMRFEELEEAIDAVADGQGMTIVPDFSVADRADVRIARPSRRRCRNPIHAVHRPGQLQPAAIELIESLRTKGSSKR